MRNYENNLRQYRKNLKLTQAQSAKAIGITTRHYQALEAKVYIPRVDVALNCAHTFHCKVEDLFSINDNTI